MSLEPFRLERYFARWEFAAPYLLCSSDLEPYRLPELLALADEDGLAHWQNLSLGYTEYPGHPLLRQEIAGLHTTIDPDEVFTFAGAEEAVFALMQTLVRSGDHVVATWPGYQSLYEVARSLGAEVTFLRLAPETGWTFDLAELRRALRPCTRLLVLNFPHNPTGALLSQDIWRDVVALAEAADICLFSDEVYRLLECDETDRLPAAADLGRRTVSLNGQRPLRTRHPRAPAEPRRAAIPTTRHRPPKRAPWGCRRRRRRTPSRRRWTPRRRCQRPERCPRPSSGCSERGPGR